MIGSHALSRFVSILKNVSAVVLAAFCVVVAVPGTLQQHFALVYLIVYVLYHSRQILFGRFHCTFAFFGHPARATGSSPNQVRLRFFILQIGC